MIGRWDILHSLTSQALLLVVAQACVYPIFPEAVTYATLSLSLSDALTM